MRTAGPKPHSKPPSKLLAAWLGLAGVLMAIPWSSGTDIDPAAAEMSEMLGALTDEMVTGRPRVLGALPTNRVLSNLQFPVELLCGSEDVCQVTEHAGLLDLDGNRDASRDSD
jgi:hypothetical protein